MVFKLFEKHGHHHKMSENVNGSGYRITYLDQRGLAEPARLILTYTGVNWEDERVDKCDLQKRSEEFPFGQVPVLSVDNSFKLSQSHAINRFLARTFHLEGKTETERALVDSYADLLYDFAQALRPYFAVVVGKVDGNKYEIYDNLVVPVAERYGKYLDGIIKDSDSGFFAPSGLTFVDFVAENFYETALQTGLDAVVKIGSLKKVHDNVHKLPQLKDYLKHRSKSQF